MPQLPKVEFIELEDGRVMDIRPMAEGKAAVVLTPSGPIPYKGDAGEIFLGTPIEPSTVVDLVSSWKAGRHKINFTVRLDMALRTAALVHERQHQHRKGSNVPYIMHPYAVMLIVSNETNDEDVLIACLLHDVLEDVDSSIYDENTMKEDFGERVVTIVKVLTKDESLEDWRKRAYAYLSHLEHEASDEAMLISAADKLHNLQTILIDYKTLGDELWERFTTKSYDDQHWWYQSVLAIARKRGVSEHITNRFADLLKELERERALPKRPSSKYPELDMNNPYDRDEHSTRVAIETLRGVRLDREKETELKQHKLIKRFKNFFKP